ncbi:MAG TPA: 6-pyruvoyl tetrahydropterin reductase, partial [Aquificaceae bacterium]|nr:6-pyruvoyl tetrahydropterin reductase [Aquificaceae bacterium]
MELFVERLTIVDFSFLHPTRGLLGESWILDVVLEGKLDAQGMIL